MSGDKIDLSATSLRGIAHPLRVRMLGVLREHGPATATLLAERLGQSTGATSYHLRQLAAYGFVEEDPERGTGRERWWRAAHRTTSLDMDAVRAAPAEAEAYMRSVAAVYAERVDRWLGESAAQPEQWRQVGTLSDTSLRLTPAEAQELHAELFALLGRYRRAHDAPDQAPPDAETVSVQWQILPFLRDAGEEAS
jgi:DNA-binding transcriptional ArsR family regulator